jgi:hypothetical protein
MVEGVFIRYSLDSDNKSAKEIIVKFALVESNVSISAIGTSFLLLTLLTPLGRTSFNLFLNLANSFGVQFFA